MYHLVICVICGLFELVAHYNPVVYANSMGNILHEGPINADEIRSIYKDILEIRSQRNQVQE